MSIGFVAGLALLGAVVAVLSGASGFLRGTPLGIAAVAVAIGLGLGYGKAVQIDPTTTPHRVLLAQVTIFTVLASVALHSSSPSIATRRLTRASEAAGEG